MSEGVGGTPLKKERNDGGGQRESERERERARENGEDDVNRAHRSSLFILRGPSTQPVAWRPAQSRASNSRKRGRVRLLIPPLPHARADRGSSDRGATDRAHRESAKYELTATRVSAACTPARRRHNSDRDCIVVLAPFYCPPPVASNFSLSLSPSLSLSLCLRKASPFSVQ